MNSLLNKDNFDREISTLKEKTKRALMGIEDVHWNLWSTDNFIEKYLPIWMQTSISETLLAIINNRKILSWLLNFDIKKFRSLHDVILSDTGVPSLDKKGYKIPDPE